MTRWPGDVDAAMALAVWRRNLTLYRRTWKLNILPNFFEPLLYLVGMGIGLGAYLGEEIGGASYVAFIAPGLMAAAAMNGATFETTYNVFVKMNFGRLYDAFLGTPAQVQDIAVGELLWATTRAAIYGLAFFVVMVGLTLTGTTIVSSAWAALAPVAVIAIGAMFGLIGLVFTAHIRTIDLYSYFYTLFLTPLFLFSGIFFPVERFPGGEIVAWLTPLYHGVRLTRDLCSGAVGLETAVSAAWIVVVSVVLYVLVPPRLGRRLLH